MLMLLVVVMVMVMAMVMDDDDDRDHDDAQNKNDDGDEDDHHIQMCLTRVSKENERMVAAGSSRRPSYCVCDYGQLGARKTGNGVG